MVTNLLGTNQALDSSLNTIISQWNILADFPTVAESVSTTYTLKPHTGVSYLINNYNRLQGYSVADGTDIAQAQALADTTTSYTPGEVAVQTWLPGSTMRRIADPDLMSRTSKILMNALNLKEDQDILANFASFSPVVGAAGRVLGPGEYLASIARLMIGNSRTNPEPAPEPYYIVDHPLKLATVAGRLVPLTDVPTGTNIYLPATTSRGPTVGGGFGGGASGSVSGDVIREGIGSLGMLFGANVKRSANLQLSGTADVAGAALSREGLIFVNEVSKRMDPDTSDKSYRGAVELNGWTSYGSGLYRAAAYGVEILGDAALPTS